ncbi:hypothetical protein ANRL2_04187 [Anaerolineae bacterium]|nr:hypothetical protein ANRL2_04187 [Anaerolineae bacterium]
MDQGVSERDAERGSGLVEMALTLPLVLLVSFVIIQFGVTAFAGSAAEAAARQGARVGSVAQVNPAGYAVAEAKRVAFTSFSAGDPQVTALAPGGVVGSELTIRVTYLVPNFIGFLGGLFAGLPSESIAVSGQASFRREGW